MNWIDAMLRYAQHDPGVEFPKDGTDPAQAADAIMAELDRVRERLAAHEERDRSIRAATLKMHPTDAWD